MLETSDVAVAREARRRYWHGKCPACQAEFDCKGSHADVVTCNACKSEFALRDMHPITGPDPGKPVKLPWMETF